MKAPYIFGLILFVGSSLALAGNLYRWVDADGKVVYSDLPPPPAAKNVQQKNFGGNFIETDQMSYAMQIAVKRYPVVLYVTNCGDLCDKAREHLKNRGIPYATKNPESQAADADALKKLTGAMEVPVLVVGNASPLKGYEAGAWDAALDSAGYPKGTARSAAAKTNVPAAKKPEAAPAAPAKKPEAKAAP